jgi:copper chaperone CopZ
VNDTVNTELLLVEGMTCEHCVMSVTEELTELDGVSDVAVQLVPGGRSEVTVTSDGPVTTEALRHAVAEAGYEVVRS